ncbi:MAG: protein-export chaperone SecB, partial [Proteobacteria bacterium]|nr:protein-export chaperone SecB [Pseudomonadota bacterium]
MAENDTIAEFGEPAANGADTAPAAGLLSQYVKDLSFENPNAPAIFQNPTAPAIDVQFNIGSAKIADEVYEVVLKIEVRATAESQAAFIVDLSYAGLFGIRNVPDPERAVAEFAKLVAVATWMEAGFVGEEPAEFKILVWETKSGNKVSELTGLKTQIQRLQFARNGKQLWSVSEDHLLQQWDITTGKNI